MNKDSFFSFLPVSYILTQDILEKHMQEEGWPSARHHSVLGLQKQMQQGVAWSYLFAYPGTVKACLDCPVLLK